MIDALIDKGPTMAGAFERSLQAGLHGCQAAAQGFLPSG
jgi:hypothetical protein